MDITTTTPILIKLYHCQCVQYLLIWSLWITTTPLHVLILLIYIRVVCWCACTKSSHARTDNPRTQVCREITCTQQIITHQIWPPRVERGQIAHVGPSTGTRTEPLLPSVIRRIYIYIYVNIYIYAYTAVSAFLLAFFHFSFPFSFFPLSSPLYLSISFSLFQFRFACELPLLKPLLSLTHYLCYKSYSRVTCITYPLVVSYSLVFLSFLSRCRRTLARALLACELSSLAKEKVAKCP